MNLSELSGLFGYLVTVVFIVLALSLIASLVIEAIAVMRRTRGKKLRRQIAHMLDDPAETGLANLVFRSPLIRALSPDGRFPDHIPPESFAQVLEAALVEHKMNTPRRMPSVLRALAHAEGFETAEGRAEFRDKLREWYERSMEQLSGNYQTGARWNLFVAGLILAICFNINLVEIASKLWAQRSALTVTASRVEAFHTELNEAVSAVREEAGKQGADAPKVDVAKLFADNPELRARLAALGEADATLKTLHIPFGWENSGDNSAIEDLFRRVWSSEWTSRNLLGWLLTALVVLPGATFWFDFLGKLLNLRSLTRPRSRAAVSDGLGA